MSLTPAEHWACILWEAVGPSQTLERAIEVASERLAALEVAHQEALDTCQQRYTELYEAVHDLAEVMAHVTHRLGRMKPTPPKDGTA